MSVYFGKFNYPPFASNENFFLDLPDGWITHGRAHVFTTLNKDGGGVSQRPFDLTTAYVLRAVNDNATSFTIRDLDDKVYYWFDGTREGDKVTLSLYSMNDSTVLSTVTLQKVN
ncbi:hypothetical protein R3P38DRAFT_3514317 [Favolaschia claudopus]|uniref:Uncharacterized protein n=1 Tax=Favolaschia claudopus TaxID=2862362 RepID=A0AAW0BTX2_9AGAR